MWRIAATACLVACTLVGSAVWAQTGTEDAVAVVLTVRGNALAGMDLTYVRSLTPAELSSDLQQIERWTGWSLGAPRQNNQSQGTACQADIIGGGILEGALTDTVWPLVAALAAHGRIGIAIIGAPVTAAPMVVENRFVHMEQSGGQGVQSYQVQIKDRSFQSVDELSRAEVATAGRSAGGRRGTAGAWFLLLAGAVVVGVAVYYLTRWALTPASGARHGRRS